MNKFIELIVGLVLLLVPIYAWIAYPTSIGKDAITFLIGGLVWLLILVGVVFILVGISDLKG